MSDKQKQHLNIGIVMPIAPIDGLSAEHWLEVRHIIEQAADQIKEYTVKSTLVSDAEDLGVIQQRIVQNLYTSDMVICDVSCRNANVMFELGMRLAFDKPTIIIKDDQTEYSFDTQVIEHISYPRDLRFSKIVSFKNDLARRIVSTYRKSLTGDGSSFLQNFGSFKVAQISETAVPADKLLFEMVQDLQSQMIRLNNSLHITKSSTNPYQNNFEFYNGIIKFIDEFREKHGFIPTFNDFIDTNTVLKENLNKEQISNIKYAYDSIFAKEVAATESIG